MTFVEMVIAINDLFGTPLTAAEEGSLIREAVTWWRRYGLSERPVIDDSTTSPTRPSASTDDCSRTVRSRRNGKQNPLKPTAIVTGASSGIGEATARLLVHRGYAVIGTSRHTAALDDDRRIPGVDYRDLDLTDPDSISHFTRGLGAVDVLVNNAGESQTGPLEELPRDAIEHLFALHVLGPVELTQQLLPGMRERGAGRIVMLSSMMQASPSPTCPPTSPPRPPSRDSPQRRGSNWHPSESRSPPSNPARSTPGCANDAPNTCATARPTSNSTRNSGRHWTPIKSTASPPTKWPRPSCARSTIRVPHRCTRSAATPRSPSPRAG